MIAVISMYNEKKEGTQVTCCINSNDYCVVQEIEAILSGIFQQQPDEFLKATNKMLERIDAKNNSNN